MTEQTCITCGKPIRECERGPITIKELDWCEAELRNGGEISVLADGDLGLRLVAAARLGMRRSRTSEDA
jgi:ferredoxin